MNIHLTMDNIDATLAEVLAGRDAKIVLWFNTVFRNHCKSTFLKEMELRTSLEEDFTGEMEYASRLHADGKHEAGAYKFKRKDGTEFVVDLDDPKLPAWYAEFCKTFPPQKKYKTATKGIARKLPTIPPVVKKPEDKYKAELVGIYLFVGKRKDGDAAVIEFKDLTPDMVKALHNGALLMTLSLANRYKATLIHLVDFLSQYHESNPDKDLTRISFNQLLTMTVEWDKVLERQKEEAALNEGTSEIFATEDGYKVFLLHSEPAVKREGARLGNCLGSNARSYLANSGAILTVRNPTGSTLAAAQLIVKLRVHDGGMVTCIHQSQFYGRANKAVPADAIEVLTQCAIYHDWRTVADPAIVYVPKSSALIDEDDEGADDEDEGDYDGDYEEEEYDEDEDENVEDEEQAEW